MDAPRCFWYVRAMRFRDQTLSVSALNRAVRLGLESEFGDVSVEGEISEVSRAASGHVYFTLSDERQAAQVRVVMFKSAAQRTRARLSAGSRVCLRGGLTLYEPRGTFQFLARSAVPAGEGDLAAQFRRLVEKLRAEGLTDAARKRPLPLLPRCIGVVTSEQGAALQDVLRVAYGRCPVRIVVAPCLVQGEGAPFSIVRALAELQNVAELDVVIVTRGGGSAEDLWAFNDESVARAIASCRVPVVSGVGHEVDTTVADLVADVRAATPSNAAELVVPEKRALETRLDGAVRRLVRALETRLGREQLALAHLTRRVADPRHRLAQAHVQLRQLERRLAQAADGRLAHARLRLDDSQRRLAALSPWARLNAQRVALMQLDARLRKSPYLFLGPRREDLRHATRRLESEQGERLARLREQLSAHAIRLSAMSPLAVLARGYAIAFVESSGKALRRSQDVLEGDTLRIRLHEGEVHARVVPR